MFEMKLTDVIRSVRDHAAKSAHWKKMEHLEGSTMRKGGILVGFDVQLAYYENKRQASRRSMVYFVLCGNTNTFMLVTNEWNEHKLDWSAFKNTSNHDSCWIHNGVDSQLTTLYFKWAEEIKKELNKPKLAPKNMDHYVFSTRNKLFQPVMVTYSTKDPKDTYRKQLLNVEMIPEGKTVAPTGQFRITNERKSDNYISIVADCRDKITAEILMGALPMEGLDEWVLCMYDDKGQRLSPVTWTKEQ